MRVALATAAELASLEDDERALVKALAALGVETCATVWDDPTVTWAEYDLVVVRSTWDYPMRRGEFVAWADSVAAVTRLANPAPVIHWNTDKRYLRDLSEKGVPVVPTHWVEPGDAVRLPDDGELVVKPAVSVGARDTARFGPAERADAAALVSRLQREGRAALVQPYLEGVDDRGETALLFLGGVYSHAVRKAPILRPGAALVDGTYAPEDIRPRRPTDVERDVAESALDAVPGGRDQLLYGRVDLLPGADGSPLLLELELTEPSLFLSHAEDATERFASAILGRLGGRASAGGRRL